MKGDKVWLYDYIDLLEEAELQTYKSPEEEDFINSVRERYDKYGNATYISKKQLNWLESIVERGS
jgi:hypothetical protein